MATFTRGVMFPRLVVSQNELVLVKGINDQVRAAASRGVNVDELARIWRSMMTMAFGQPLVDAILTEALDDRRPWVGLDVELEERRHVSC